MRDNKGITLVELLVALAIASIISGSIGYFIYHSIRMYTDETVDISLQQELQTSVNTVMDAVMESQCLILDNKADAPDKVKTNAVVLGTVKKTGSSGGTNTYKFKGFIFAASDEVSTDPTKPADTSGIAGGKLYKMPCDDLECSGTDFYEAIKSAATSEGSANSFDMVKDTKYLMTECVQNFGVSVAKAYTVSGNALPDIVPEAEVDGAKDKYSFWQEKRKQEDGTYKNVGIYHNSITLNISLSFASVRGSGIEYKIVNDKAVMRNHLSEDIYLIVNGSKYQFIEYDEEKKRSGNDLEVETVNVEKEIALGDIWAGKTDTEEGLDSKEIRNILEIVPDKYNSVMGYLIGGKEPVDPAGLDAAMNKELGYSDGVNEGIAKEMTPLIGDSSGTNHSNFRWSKRQYSGYFEKVAIGDRIGNDDANLGGTYAIKNIPGTSTPMITGTFKPVEHDYMLEHKDKLYYTKYYEGNIDYKTIIRIDGKSWDGDTTYFENVYDPDYTYGNTGGTVSDNSLSGNSVSDNSISDNTASESIFYTDDQGEEHVKDGTYYVFSWVKTGDGYKYESVYFLSEYAYYDKANYSENHSYSSASYSGSLFLQSEISSRDDFCWVWHDVDDPRITTDQSTDDYSKYLPDPEHTGMNYLIIGDNDSTKKIYDVELKDFENLPVHSKIYVNNYTKFDIRNNEMFILYCMSKDTTDGTYGLYNSDLETTGNLSVLNTFYGDSLYSKNLFSTDNLNGFNLMTRTPGEVRDDDVRIADLIVIACRKGGLYGYAQKLYGLERSLGGYDTSDSGGDKFANDISPSVMLLIYDKVINNNVALACTRNLDRFEDNRAGEKNLTRLATMLYKFQNKNIVYSEECEGHPAGFYYNKENKNPYVKVSSDYEQPDWAMEYVRKNGVSSYDYSGRILFTDFIKSYVTDSKAYSSLMENNGQPIKDKEGRVYYPSTFLYMLNDGQLYTGDVNSFTAASDKKYTWTNTPHADYNTVFDVDPFLFPNIYADHKGGSYEFIYDSYYGEKGFRYNNTFDVGKYANQMMFEDDGTLLQYDKQNGLKTLGEIIKIADVSGSKIKTTKVKVGDIEVVGAGKRKPGFNETTNPDSSAVNYKDAGIKYQCGVSEYPYQYTYTDPTTNEAKTGTKYQKVIYLNDYEYEDAKTNGLDLYCLVYVMQKYDLFSADGTIFYANSYLQNKVITDLKTGTTELDGTTYNKVVKDEDNNIIYIDNDGHKAFKNEEITNETNSTTEDYKIVEFVYHIPDKFFDKTDRPFDEEDGMFEATIDIDDKTNPLANGTDSVRIVVRDTFDLD